MFGPHSVSHLTDADLLMLHDGELSIRAAREYRKHLEDCWACRYRAEELSATIFRFVECCDIVTARSAPPRNLAESLHRRLRAQAPQKSFRTRLGVLLKPRLLTCLVTVAALLYVSISDHLLPAAQATEILQNADRTEAESISKSQKSAIRQHLRISSSGKNLQCEFWRSAAGPETRSTCDGDAEFKILLESVYAVNSWDSNRPMSAATFLKWHARIQPMLTEYQRDDLRDLITIRHRVPPWSERHRPSAIREASITLTSRTLHSLEQSLRIRTGSGEREIRFREVSYEVIPYNQTPFAATPAPAVKPLGRGPRHLPAPINTQSVSPEDLENAEVQLRIALHQLHADTEMTPEISRQNGRIVLGMLVDTEELQRTIRSAASSVPLVDVQVWTPENAPATFRVAASSAQPGTGRIYRTSGTGLGDLTKCLSSPDAAMNYIDRTQRSIRRLMVPALALRRLLESYPASRYGAIPERSRVKLDAIALDYFTSIQEGSVRLRNELIPILRQCGFAKGGEPAAETTRHSGDTWQTAGSRLESDVRELEAAFNQLFATTESARAPIAGSSVGEKLVVLSNKLSSIDIEALRERAGTLPENLSVNKQPGETRSPE